MYVYDRRIKGRSRTILHRVAGLSILAVFAVSGTAFAAARMPSIAQKVPGTAAYHRARSEARVRNGTNRNNPQRFGSSTGSNGSNTPSGSSSDVLGAFISKSCAAQPTMTPNLQKSIVPQIRKLTEYEAVCGGRITDTSMLFAAMPSDANNARELATDLAIGLKEFAKYNLRPIVIWEPVTDKGPIPFAAFRNGAYDGALETYFQTLKGQGITDQTMGIWVPFPESNIPEWDTTDPALVAANITKAVQIQKKHFPSSKASIMLDSLSYPAGTKSWDGGKYVSFNPYLKDVPKGLIDSFGYQGFPWAPPANEPGPANLAASTFLQSGLVIEAAKILGVKEVWLNTGTFNKMHTTPGQVTSLDVAKRRQILGDILNEAKKVKNAGLKVSIHIFAEDKSMVAEGTDWSYWPQGRYAGSESAEAFKAFAAGVRDNQMDLWIFDIMR